MLHKAFTLGLLLMCVISACQAAPETPTVAPTVAFTPSSELPTTTLTPALESPTETLEPTHTPIPNTPKPTTAPSATATPILCPGAPPITLEVGQTARVKTDPPRANRMRQEPNREAQVLGEIQPGEVVGVIDGPVCGDNFTWWKVRRNDESSGWTVEGTGTTYWLEKGWLHNVILVTVPYTYPSLSYPGRIISTNRLFFISVGDVPVSKPMPVLVFPIECSGSETEFCHRYNFSSDGHWMEFNYGSTGVSCGGGQAILIMNLATGESHEIVQDANLTAFLPNGQALVSTFHCEGGEVYRYNLQTEALEYLGIEGFKIWNSAHTAFVINENPYQGYPSIWSFNVEQGRQIPFPERGYEDRLLRAPDGDHVLYQHRPYTLTEPNEAGNRLKVFKARQIQSINPVDGEIQVLASDPQYDYHLCATRDSGCEWQGDWIQVRRVRFRPPERYLDQCHDYTQNCADPVELFALNWRTGELVPWEQAPLPTATSIPEPTATPTHGPNLNTSPIYVEPSGAYAFYVGMDGHSLWLVPTNGAPELWVTEGEDFVYVP